MGVVAKIEARMAIVSQRQNLHQRYAKMRMIQGLVQAFQRSNATFGFHSRRGPIRAVERYQLAEIAEVLALRFEVVGRLWIVCLRRCCVEMPQHRVSQGTSEGADYEDDQDNGLANSHQGAHPC